MIKWLMLLMCLASPAGAADWRLVGTNLYDFSKVGNFYKLSGPCLHIVKVYPKSVQVRVDQVEEQFVPEYSRPIPGDPASMLYTLSQFRMMHNNDGSPVKMSPAAAWMMGIDGHEIEVPKTYFIYILNYPGGTEGSQPECFAVPTARRGVYDCGVPFTGDPDDYKYIYRVGEESIKCERHHTAAERAAEAERLFQFQLEQATNNVAEDQWAVSRHYFPTNKALGTYWLNLAVSNGLPAAVQYQAGLGQKSQTNLDDHGLTRTAP